MAEAYQATANTRLIYRFDGGVTDSSGNGYDGTASTITYVGGLVDRAASFNGSSSYVTLPAIASFLGGDFTIGCWVKRASTDANQGLLYYGNSNANNCVNFQLTSTNYARLFVDNSTGTWDFGTIGTNYTIDTGWHHVLATFDYAATATTKIYVDGLLDATGTKATPGTINGSGYQWLGANISSTSKGEYYGGLMDELIIENTIWTAEQIYNYFIKSSKFFQMF